MFVCVCVCVCVCMCSTYIMCTHKTMHAHTHTHTHKHLCTCGSMYKSMCRLTDEHLHSQMDELKTQKTFWLLMTANSTQMINTTKYWKIVQFNLHTSLLTNTLSVTMPSFWLTIGTSLSKYLAVRRMPRAGSILKKFPGSKGQFKVKQYLTIGSSKYRQYVDWLMSSSLTDHSCGLL